MTQEELKKAIAEGKGGVYVFIGEEEYLKRHYLSEFKKAILDGEPTFAAFNHQSFEGREIDFAALLDVVRTPSMFADGKLIEWQINEGIDKRREDLNKNDVIFSEKLTEEKQERAVLLKGGIDKGFLICVALLLMLK